MADVANNILEKIVENAVVVNQEKSYKTKDYVRRAKLKYELKKYAEDPEYRTKRLESCKKSHQNNPEKYREYSKLYMREYRAKKKADKLLQETTKTSQSITPIVDLPINNLLTDSIIEITNEITNDITDKLLTVEIN